MFRKCKVILLLFLIISLSFVPSVNSASDIFNEKRHLSYDTLKSRMIDYVNTPDYFKPYVSSVIGRDEYFDIDDLFLATQDLTSILPSVNNGSLEDVSNTPLFKTLNTVYINELKEFKAYLENPTEGQLLDFLQPYGTSKAESFSVYTNYMRAAHDLQNIFNDYFLHKNAGVDNPFVAKPNERVTVDGIDYTVLELMDRVSSSTISIDGYYMFSNKAPLASGSAPERVSVDSVAVFTKDRFYIGDGGQMNYILRNRALEDSGLSGIDIKGVYGPEYKTVAANSGYPKILAEKNNPNTYAVLDYHGARELLATVDSRVNPTTNQRVNIVPESVQQSTNILGIATTPEGNILVTKNEIIEKSIGAFAYIEGTVMLIFAVVCFITAWVYK
jgi:hypothetical protein